MELRAEFEGIEMTLKIPEDALSFEEVPSQLQSIVRGALQQNLELLLQIQVGTIAAAMKAGSLQGILLDLMETKLGEAIKESKGYLFAVTSGQQKAEDVVYKYLLTKVQDHESEDGIPLRNLFDRLDPDSPIQ